MRLVGLLCLFTVTFWVLGCTATVPSSEFETSTHDMYGFRGIEWDTPLEQIQSELAVVGMDQERKLGWYRKEHEELSLGEATVESIQYVFYENMFKRVAIVARGEENSGSLRDYFFETCGEASKSTNGTYTWNLDTTTIMFAYNQETGITLLILQKRPDSK